MPKFNIAIARFPYKKEENSTVADWLVSTVLDMKRDDRIGNIARIILDDTPITMTRNKAVENARKTNSDYLFMIDSDMAPDLYFGKDPSAKQFWKTAFDFAVKHEGPCAVAAPYCGPPPHENIYVFRWQNMQSDCPDDSEVGRVLEQFTRSECATRTGIEQVAALPTGLILFDMRAFDHLDHPYFEYEWKDEKMAEKASTEDVVLTRNLALVGVKQYCAWDCWAGHWKLKCVGKPHLQTEESVAETLRAPLLRKQEVDKTPMEQIGGKFDPQWEPPKAIANGKPKALTGRKARK